MHAVMRPQVLARFSSVKRSLKYRLIVSFCLLSIAPLTVMQVVSYYDIAGKLQKKIDALENINLVQTRKIIRTSLDFYEDLLYQMYTDDHLIELVNELNEGENSEFVSGQLRRSLHAYVYTMPFVQSITVLTSSGRMVFDDLLTGYNTKTSWLDVAGGQPEELFRTLASGNDTVVLPSSLASFYTAKRHYLFHMGHRFIDYRNVWRKNGAIILSIDERMLGEICDERLDKGSGVGMDESTFIVAGDGTVVSFPDESLVGLRLDLPGDPPGRAEAIRRAIAGAGVADAGKRSIYELKEPKTGWSVVAARNQAVMYQEISARQRIAIVVVLASVVVLLAIILFITGRLTRSIGAVVAAMNAAAAGELSARIDKDEAMPLEIEEIAANFNAMIEKIRALIEEVQAASTKQRNAEIAALEAQVNPHFLYNTLDTINWMAIDREEFEISGAINALAEILRYGIDGSNGVVEIRQEVQWLKNYVSLQRTRLKGAFEFALDVDPSAMDCRIHKLLFQPFVENSIVHGFRGLDGRRVLSVSIRKEGARVRIEVADDGKGMAEGALSEIEAGAPPEAGGKGHIGMRNAIARIKMYYGPEASVAVESAPGKGTRVLIEYPAS
jgi:two-component system, sensor histidine kinase YesM